MTIDESRLNERRLESILKVSQYNAKSIQDLLEYALDEAILLTDSKIGCIYFYDDNKKEFILNSSSKNVMKECIIINSQTNYNLDKTGTCEEVIRQAKPIVVNDFSTRHSLK